MILNSCGPGSAKRAERQSNASDEVGLWQKKSGPSEGPPSIVLNIWVADPQICSMKLRSLMFTWVQVSASQLTMVRFRATSRRR